MKARQNAGFFHIASRLGKLSSRSRSIEECSEISTCKLSFAKRSFIVHRHSKRGEVLGKRRFIDTSGGAWTSKRIGCSSRHSRLFPFFQESA